MIIENFYTKYAEDQKFVHQYSECYVAKGLLVCRVSRCENEVFVLALLLLCQALHQSLHSLASPSPWDIIH